VWFGEAIRDVVYGLTDISQLAETLRNKSSVDVNAHPKWLLYSGLFVLLKQKLRLSADQVTTISQVAAGAFATLVQGNVRTCV